MNIFKMENSTYDAWKWVAQVLLPALGALYFALAQIWPLPLAEQIVGTITAVDAFLGIILGISSANYHAEIEYKGKQAITPEDEEND